eukprot:SAG11_NODE_21319_length_427_cov_2.204268_1_plen_79_part_01
MYHFFFTSYGELYPLNLRSRGMSTVQLYGYRVLEYGIENFPPKRFVKMSLDSMRHGLLYTGYEAILIHELGQAPHFSTS